MAGWPDPSSPLSRLGPPAHRDRRALDPNVRQPARWYSAEADSGPSHSPSPFEPDSNCAALDVERHAGGIGGGDLAPRAPSPIPEARVQRAGQG